MRILFLTWNYPPVVGGMEYLACSIHHGLRRRGHHCTVVTRHSVAPAADTAVHRAPRPGLPAYLMYAAARGALLARQATPEVILCGSVVTAPAGLLLSRLTGAPFVVLIHGSDILLQRWWYQRLVRLVLPRARTLVANSTPTGDLLLNAGVDRSRIAVVHPGIDIQQLGDPGVPDPKIAALTAGRAVLLSVGRLVSRKGFIEFAQRVMPRLVVSHPQILWLVVGEDATASLVHRERLRWRLQEIIEQHHLQRHARLLGHVPDAQLRWLYHRADLFVLPVRPDPADVEGFGIVFLEAAMGGTASVATRLGGIPDAVADGCSGLLVEPADDDQLTATLQRLLDDPARVELLGTQARERAARDFGWDAVLTQHERVLHAAARQGRRSGRSPAIRQDAAQHHYGSRVHPQTQREITS